MTTDIHELVGAYATDALDDAERTAFEDHLGSCADCRAELAAYREVLAAVAGAHPVLPPESMEDTVVAAVASGSAGTPVAGTPVTGEAAGPGAAGGDTPGRDAAALADPDPTIVPLAPRRRASTWLAVAAASAALFAGGMVVGRQSAPVAPVAAGGDMDSILAVAAANDASFLPVDLMGTSTRVVVSDEMGKVAVIASDLPTPAKGMCYQVWRVAEDGTKESAGTFTPDADGHVAVVLEGGTDATAFVITMEPPGGSKAPTGEMVGQVDA